MRILLTGAATMAGAEVLRELLRWPDAASIGLLMPPDESARTRALQRLEAYVGPLPASVTTVVADLRLPRFGLSLGAWDALAQSIDVAIHCAQRETPDQKLDLARQANLLPVENWIQLLDRNPDLRLHHLSTAFVAGTRRGLFTEFDLDTGQTFHNAWERSKFEAEVRLRESRASERVTIYRPSHILGRAATGEAFELGGGYPLLATLAAASVLPGDGRARIDFVSVDYVASAIAALVSANATGTFHLASGWHESLSVKEAATLAAKARDRKRGATLLPRALAWPLREPAGELLHQGPVFDTYLADRALAPLGVERRPLRPAVGSTAEAAAAWLATAVRRAAARGWEGPAAAEFEVAAAEAALPATAAEAALIRKDPRFREKQFHQIGDVNVAYRDIGSGEPVVFLHGFAGAHAWDGVVERIAGQRRAVIVETLGLSDTTGPSTADFSLQAQAARVRGLLSALEIPAAHIVGNDAGGVIAQFFAVRWPHIVKSLTLSDCGIDGPRPRLSKIPAIARSSHGFGKLVHDRRFLTPERIAAYVDTVAGDRERRMRYKRFLQSLQSTDMATLQQLLGQLEVPAMIVWGAENAYWSPSWARTLYEAIPGARRLELIPFAGISCHEEKPDVFARLLTQFFDEAERHQSSGTSAFTSRVYTTYRSPSRSIIIASS